MNAPLKQPPYLQQRDAKLPAICVCQPWASAIISGLKVRENRSKPWAYEGPVLIHASLTMNDWWFSTANRRLHMTRERFDRMPRGGFIGVAYLYHVKNNSKGEAHHYGYYLSHPAWFPRVIHAPGSQGIFYPDDAAWKIIRPILKRLDEGERFPPIVEV